ncbi:MAG: hypothetical protein HXS54_06035 [Theionarchaea archaeon]|nr:hypothetical protein [Theionarchaea archaeon]
MITKIQTTESLTPPSSLKFGRYYFRWVVPMLDTRRRARQLSNEFKQTHRVKIVQFNDAWCVYILRKVK